MSGAATTHNNNQLVLEQAVKLAESVYTLIYSLEKEYVFNCAGRCSC
jgi:hypothetical protein